jgi:hypothetical protein
LEVVLVPELLRIDRTGHAGRAAISRARSGHLIRTAASAVVSLALIDASPASKADPSTHVTEIPIRSGPAVAVSGQKIVVDGQATFLSGVSLFDALGPTPPRDQDLDALRTWGVNTVRVWAHWHEPIYQKDGALSAAGRSRLLALVQRLQARGLLLELVLLRPGQLAGQGYTAFASEAAHAAVRDDDGARIIATLFDSATRTIADGPISPRHATAGPSAIVPRASSRSRVPATI